MPRHWTPEQRAAFGEKMRQRREAAKLATPELNPIATDVLPPTPKKKMGRPAKPKLPAPPVLAEAKLPKLATTDISRIVSSLETLPIPDISYGDCGILLNALSACSTAIALARRQKQEQLEAGTHRAPCKTCGRMIDISKSGGFQILTERDEFHMPKNVYFCSQNCLLAKNMPSHARQTPRHKMENQA